MAKDKNMVTFAPMDRAPDACTSEVMQSDLMVEGGRHGSSVTPWEKSVHLTIGTNERPVEDNIPVVVVMTSSPFEFEHTRVL